MATVDHRKLDAYASARLEIKRRLDSIQRRMYDEAKTEIDTEIQRRLANGSDYDGHAIGAEATERVISGWFVEGEPQPAIEAQASRAD
jgi:hypothetical protein